MAIVRAIVWFVIFHIGVDFWIFPNYFIDSDNILDSFWPLFSLERREDMFDVRMLVLRVASGFAIFYGAQEFMKDPENLEGLIGGSAEMWDEMYDWGQNKFMGTVDPNQQIEVKKSARQIFSEAFMDEENPMFRSTNNREYADEDALREKYEEEQKLSAEERARAAFDSAQADLDEEEEAIKNDDNEEDPLDKLTGNIDDEMPEDAEQNPNAEHLKATSDARAAAYAEKAKKEATEKAAKAVEDLKAKANAMAEAQTKAKAEAAEKIAAEQK